MNEDDKPLTPEEVQALGFDSAPEIDDDAPLSPDEVKALGFGSAPEEIPAAVSGVRGALQGVTMGAADEILGGIQGGMNWVGSGFQSDLGDEYRKARDEYRELYGESAKQNPTSYAVGNVTGSVAPMLLPVGAAARGTMLAARAGKGALQGAGGSLMESEADLTQGDPAQLKQAALETAQGAGLGAVAGAHPLGALAVGGYGAANAYFDDDMSEADKKIAYLNALMAAGGAASKARGVLAEKSKAAADQATGEVRSKLRAADTAEAESRKKSVVETATERLGEEARQKAVAAQEQKVAGLSAEQARRQQVQAGREYRSEQAEKMKVGVSALKKREQILRSAERLGDADQRKLAATVKELDAAKADLAGADASARAKFASEHAAHVQKLQNYMKLNELESPSELPPDYLDMWNYLRESQAQGLEAKMAKGGRAGLEAMAEESVAGRRAAGEARVAAAEEAVQAKPRSQAELEAQAQKDLADKARSRVSPEEQARIFQEAGLETPRGFQYQQGMEPLRIAGRAVPETPTAKPDSMAARIADEQARLDQMRAPADELAGVRQDVRDAAEAAGVEIPGLEDIKTLKGLRNAVAKLRGVASSGPELDARVKEAARQGRNEFLVKEASQLGAVGGGAALGGTLGGPVGAALGSLATGIKGGQSIARFISKDPKTGQYKNPEAVASILGAFSRIAKQSDSPLAKKYRQVLGTKLSPVQVMYYVDRDPELLNALVAELGAE